MVTTVHAAFLLRGRARVKLIDAYHYDYECYYYLFTIAGNIKCIISMFRNQPYRLVYVKTIINNVFSSSEDK